MRRSCSSVRPRRRVPAIGRLITRPSSTCTIGSGDEPTSVASGWRTKYMYGDGLTWRSTRYTSNGSTVPVEVEALREHDLEDVAGEDVLARRLDRVAGTSRRPSSSVNGGQLARARPRAAATARTAAGAASSSTWASSRRHGRVVRGVDLAPSSAPRREEDVLDQVEALAEVVERGDVPGERQHRVGQAEVVGRHVGQALDLAHDVVAEVADDAAVERRELGEASARGTRASSASSAASAPWSAGTPGGGVAGRTRRARPRTTSVSAGSRPRNENRPQRSACSTDSSRNPADRLAAPDELHERRDGRLEVGEDLAPDRHDGVLAGERDGTRRATAGRRRRSLRRGPGAAPLPKARKKQLCSPVWHAPRPSCSTTKSRTSTSQS